MSNKKNRPAPGPSRVDHADLLRPYVGKWVVLSQDESRVLASGRTLNEATRRVHGVKRECTVVTLVPPDDVVLLL